MVVVWRTRVDTTVMLCQVPQLQPPVFPDRISHRIPPFEDRISYHAHLYSYSYFVSCYSRLRWVPVFRSCLGGPAERLVSTFGAGRWTSCVTPGGRGSSHSGGCTQPTTLSVLQSSFLPTSAETMQPPCCPSECTLRFCRDRALCKPMCTSFHSLVLAARGNV
jgi:hypothetical protein